jgi:hypothetical protein
MKEYYLKNKDNIVRKQKEYYLDNKDELIKKQKEYYLDNKEKRKEYYLDNKEKRKEYYLDNKNDILEKKKQKYKCVCGSVCGIYNKNKHFKTNKHQEYSKNVK